MLNEHHVTVMLNEHHVTVMLNEVKHDSEWMISEVQTDISLPKFK